ncbi:Chalcone isomerase-like [Polaromonas sp. YR568]|uniref:chalcone isomerase family protein n=1 Tax=Polaromonas sp. YR568 TaxID=1855301 RepID=UPI0008E62E71|nr:chalcone isomerase family protein [Polaromonas sp. YR568]SFU39453.1 Chalcone isomerase-like [Polaromonas sp. YR568]
MKHLSFTTLALSCALPFLFAAAPLHAADAERPGAAWQPTLQSGAATLQLNGAGVRRQGASGLYTAGLYLDQKLATPDAVLANAGAKQLRVVMLRDVSADQMGDLLARGMLANASDEELLRLAPLLFRLGEILGGQKQLAAGDSFQIDWQPGAGTAIRINGQLRGEPFSEPEAFGVMLRLWLGPQPADGALKNALLGQQT